MNKIFYKPGMYLCVFLCAVILSCDKSKEANAGKYDLQINNAVIAADLWIKLIDDEKYGESWESAAGIFRGAIIKEKWIEAVTAVRKPIGKVTSRNSASKEFHKELPGVPDGEYVLIKYRSSFALKKRTMELITVAKEPDNTWKVAGYFVK